MKGFTIYSIIISSLNKHLPPVLKHGPRSLAI